MCTILPELPIFSWMNTIYASTKKFNYDIDVFMFVYPLDIQIFQ